MSEKHIYFCPKCGDLRETGHDYLSMPCDCGADAIRADSRLVAAMRALFVAEIQALRSKLVLMTADNARLWREAAALRRSVRVSLEILGDAQKKEAKLENERNDLLRTLNDAAICLPPSPGNDDVKSHILRAVAKAEKES